MRLEVRAVEVIEVTVLDKKGLAQVKTIFPVQDTKNATGSGGVLWLTVESAGKKLGAVPYAGPDDRGKALEDLAGAVRVALAEQGA